MYSSIIPMTLYPWLLSSLRLCLSYVTGLYNLTGNLYVPGLMDGHQDRSGVLRHLGQGLHQTVGRERVKAGRWFVQEQNTYGEYKGPRVTC